MSVLEHNKHKYQLIGGDISLDFVNTRSNYIDKDTPTQDYFDTYAELANWAQQVGIITSEEEQKLSTQAADQPGQADAALQRARELRLAIQRTLLAASEGISPDRASFDTFKRELYNAMAQVSLLETESGYEWGWQPAPNSLDSFLRPVVKSAADLLISDKIARVHECAGEHCGWVFVDTSKNHRRRWCDMKDCGNAAKVRRHYHRNKSNTNTE